MEWARSTSFFDAQRVLGHGLVEVERRRVRGLLRAGRRFRAASASSYTFLPASALAKATATLVRTNGSCFASLRTAGHSRRGPGPRLRGRSARQRLGLAAAQRQRVRDAVEDGAAVVLPDLVDGGRVELVDRLEPAHGPRLGGVGGHRLERAERRMPATPTAGSARRRRPPAERRPRGPRRPATCEASWTGLLGRRTPHNTLLYHDGRHNGLKGDDRRTRGERRFAEAFSSRVARTLLRSVATGSPPSPACAACPASCPAARTAAAARSG